MVACSTSKAKQNALFPGHPRTVLNAALDLRCYRDTDLSILRLRRAFRRRHRTFRRGTVLRRRHRTTGAVAGRPGSDGDRSRGRQRNFMKREVRPLCRRSSRLCRRGGLVEQREALPRRPFLEPVRERRERPGAPRLPGHTERARLPRRWRWRVRNGRRTRTRWRANVSRSASDRMKVPAASHAASARMFTNKRRAARCRHGRRNEGSLPRTPVESSVVSLSDLEPTKHLRLAPRPPPVREARSGGAAVSPSRRHPWLERAPGPRGAPIGGARAGRGLARLR
jgi:hypothetical protein